MSMNYWFYLKNIFVNPVKAFNSILSEERLMRISVISFMIGCFSYVIITLIGYQAIGWGNFPYKEFYPDYFTPYWWEVFVNPVWGAVIAFGFGIPCYFFGRIFKGQGTWLQTITVVLLSSIVSLPIFLLVDLYTLLYYPDIIEVFVKYGFESVKAENYDSDVFRIIHQSYAYLAMTWQGIITLIGLSKIHRTKWYSHIPGIVAGNIVFMIFAILIRDHVAIIL